MNSCTLNFPDGPRTFWLRAGTSDANMAAQTFRDRAFDLTTLKRWPEIVAWLTENPEPLIVDAGANIGTSAVWFSKMIPGSYVVAIEPETSNWEMLKRNMDGLSGVAWRAAISSQRGHAEVYHPSGDPTGTVGHAGYRTRRAETGVEAVTMEQLTSVAAGTPFLAKIDIEGAECDLFAGDCSWIDYFPVLIVELHDWLYPGEGLSRPFIWAMHHFDRDFIVRGEHVISIRNPLSDPTY